MKNQKHLMMVILNAILLCTSGCMSVKDTSGIKNYLQDQGKAEILAIEIKDKNPDENSTAYQNAERLYNEAAGAGNGWTKGIVFDARMKREVNVSTEDYTNSKAGKAISEFLSLGSNLTYAKKYSFDPVTATTLATFIVGCIDRIEQQNDERVERAIEAIDGEFSRAYWTTFKNTTTDWIDNKYKLSSKGS